MKTPREILCQALPRSQDDFVADELLVALAEAGYVIVPKDPTPAMLSAAWASALAENAANVWDDMISVAVSGQAAVDAKEPK